MFEWLRRWLKKWLLEEEDLTTIEFKDNGNEVQIGKVVAAAGIYLRVLTGHSELLIMEREATDMKKFRRIWNHLRKNDKIEWEDE